MIDCVINIEMLIHNHGSEFEQSAFDNICEKELEDFVIKFGSLLSMVNGKTVSIVFMFNCLLNSSAWKDLFCKSADIEWHDAVNFLVKRYPILSKSKKIQQEELEVE